MSNILSDLERQAIALEIIQHVKPACYVDVGCHRGASIDWWIKHIPTIFGCDIDEDAVKECQFKFPTGAFVVCDSRCWLGSGIEIPQPAVFYLDTDWVADLAKVVELEIIIKKWPKSVIIANGVNQPDHPYYGQANRPWDVDVFLRQYGQHFNQFIVPVYKWPVLQQGYVIMNGTDVKLRVYPHKFLDMLPSLG